MEDESVLDEFRPLIAEAANAFRADFRYAEAIAIQANTILRKQDELSRVREYRFVATE